VNDTAKDTADGAGQWWDPGLLARWIGANAAAYAVVVGGEHAWERITPVGAKNSVAASDQRLRPQATLHSRSAARVA
jgi:hypothetical protein